MSHARKTCVFCQGTGVKMSREHVFARWLAELVPGGTAPTRYQKFAIPDDGPPTILKSLSWQSARNDTGIKFGRVCVSCNSGWMARLESEVKLILTPLILGKNPATITVSDQLVVLRWVMKTAFLFDVLRPAEHPPFFTERDRLLIATSTDLPFRPVVFLAAYEGEVFGLGAFFVQLTFGARRGRDGNVDADQVEFHITLNIGRLAIQMMCLLPNPSTPTIRWKPVPSFWRDFTYDITLPTTTLPRLSRDLTWPPPKALDDEMFILFRDRWMQQYMAEGHLSALRATLE